MGGEVHSSSDRLSAPLKEEKCPAAEEILKRERASAKAAAKSERCSALRSRRHRRVAAVFLILLSLGISIQFLLTVTRSQWLNLNFEVPTMQHNGHIRGADFHFTYSQPVIFFAFLALVLQSALLAARKRYFRKQSDSMARVLLLLILFVFVNQLALTYQNATLYHTDKVYNQIAHKFDRAGFLPHHHNYHYSCRGSLVLLSLALMIGQLMYSWLALHLLTRKHGRNLFGVSRCVQQFFRRVRDRMRQLREERLARCQRQAPVQRTFTLFVKSDADRFYKEVKVQNLTVDALKRAIVDTWGLNRDSEMLILKHGDVLVDSDQHVVADRNCRYLFFSDLQ